MTMRFVTLICLVMLSVHSLAVAQAPAASDPAYSRRVQYGEDDVIRVKTKLRFTTLIVLPKDETILDFTCGDKEFWVINGTKNLAYCKPSRAGSETNLNLVAASGNVYSFILTEVSGDADSLPDLKIFVEAKDASFLSGIKTEPKFVPSEEASFYRDQVADAKAEAKEAKSSAEKAAENRINSFLSAYPSTLKFDYRFPANQKPFLLSAIWNDGRFTYIKSGSREVPALYEMKDGKANLVSFDYSDGMFIVRKVIDSGYLAIGKAKQSFFRTEAR